MTDVSLTSTLAAPPKRFRPAAAKPRERDPSVFELFSPRVAKNLLTAVPRASFEQRYRRVRMLQFVYHGVSDPDAIKRVFLDNAANYRRPGLVQRILRPVIGEGLLTAEANVWKGQRRLMAPAFAPHAVAAFAPLFENFDPEAKAERHRYQYIPFGAGPRICIGMGFAQAEALMILSRWLAEFRFTPARGHVVEPRADFSLRPEGGLPQVVERLEP